MPELTIEQMIASLTSSEGDTLTILATDPEAFDKVVTIDVCGQWSDWDECRFHGTDLAHALRQAEIIKRINDQ